MEFNFGCLDARIVKSIKWRMIVSNIFSITKIRIEIGLNDVAYLLYGIICQYGYLRFS